MDMDEHAIAADLLSDAGFHRSAELLRYFSNTVEYELHPSGTVAIEAQCPVPEGGVNINSHPFDQQGSLFRLDECNWDSSRDHVQLRFVPKPS